MSRRAPSTKIVRRVGDVATYRQSVRRHPQSKPEALTIALPMLMDGLHSMARQAAVILGKPRVRVATGDDEWLLYEAIAPVIAFER
jgi:hypothetical protein